MKDWLTIGQFAEQTGFTARALRIYEKKGLLKATERGENGYRYFHSRQLDEAKKISQFKNIGFSLDEILKILQSKEDLSKLLEKRLQKIQSEKKIFVEQEEKIKKILSSLKKAKTKLKPRERTFIMSLYKKAKIVVTGVGSLSEIAENIRFHLKNAGEETQIGDLSMDGPGVYIIPEEELENERVKTLCPDVVVVAKMSSYSPELVQRYLNFYDQVGPEMSTILNADDRASIEIAKMDTVKKGKIYYFSKNKGLKNQIENIGGLVSNGEEIDVFGFNRGRPRIEMNIKIKNVLSQDQEVALLASLGAVMDIGLAQELIPGEI